MRTFLLLTAVVQSVLCGGISQYAVQMPFLNPAGVTYVNGPAPAGLAAGPLHYAAPAVAPLQYAAPAPLAYAPQAYAPQAYAPQVYSQAFGRQAYGYQQHYAAPAPFAYAAAPAFAHAKIPTVHAVPTVHHVQGVADVPYTRVVATPGVVQKQLDVAKPHLSTRKFQVRRPAIQKQFYDIEERVVVRNAGSALLELDEPTSKTQQGPAVIKPVHALHYPQLAVAPVFAQQFHPTLVQQFSPVPVQSFNPASAPAPVQAPAPAPAPAQEQNPAPAPAQEETNATPEAPVQGPAPEIASDDDSIVVENTDFTARSAQPQAPAQMPNAVRQRFNDQRMQLEAAQQELTARQNQLTQEIQQEMQYQARQQSQPQEQTRQQAPQEQQPEQKQQQEQQPEQQQDQAQQEQQDQPQEQQQEARAQTPITQARFVPQPQRPAFRRADVAPLVDIRSNGAPFDLIPQARAGPSVVPSVRNGPEVNQANQQTFIQLLTAQGGVAEVGFGRSGPSGAPVGDAGNVRARVLSATPAPEHERNAPAGERVSTRRVVVSRPIETLQEFDVVEPVTKVHRVTVNQPTVFKTLQHEVARVPTSYPVYGKALHHSYAHATVPLSYYHH